MPQSLRSASRSVHRWRMRRNKMWIMEGGIDGGMEGWRGCGGSLQMSRTLTSSRQPVTDPQWPDPTVRICLLSAGGDDSQSHTDTNIVMNPVHTHWLFVWCSSSTVFLIEWPGAVCPVKVLDCVSWPYAANQRPRFSQDGFCHRFFTGCQVYMYWIIQTVLKIKCCTKIKHLFP